MISLDEAGQKIAGFMGDDKSYGVKETDAFYDYTKLTDHIPLNSLLPYQAYEPVRRFFLNDYSVGFGLELNPLSGCSESEILRITTLLNSNLKEGAFLHVQLIASTKIGSVLEKFNDARGVDSSINKRLAEQRIRYYATSTKKSVNKNYPFFLRDYRLFVYYTESVQQNHDIQFEGLDKLREIFRSSLDSITSVRDLDIQSFLSLMKDMLNPSFNVNSALVEYDPLNRISDQMLNSNTIYDISDTNIAVKVHNEEIIIQNYNIDKYPNEISIWQTRNNIGNIFDKSLQLSCPFIFNIHLKILDRGKSRARAQTQVMMNEKKANSPMAKAIPSLKDKHIEWGEIRKRLDEDDNLVEIAYQITTFSEKSRYIYDQTKIKNVFEHNKMEVNIDAGFQLPSFLLNLPFAMSENYFKGLKYYGNTKTMYISNAVHLMPLLAESKGWGNANGMMFVGRQGQLANYNIFSNSDGNSNTIIVAKSRGGKSFLMQEMICDTLSYKGIVRVIDLGRSYEKLCKLVGGQYIEMTEGVCINPFTHVVDINKSLSQIKSIVATMAHPSGEASDKELAYIAKAIQLAWDKKNNITTITDVVTILSGFNNEVSDDLALLLQKYTTGGQFERYFDGNSTIDISNKFIVLELEELKDKPDLKSVVVLSIMLQITEEFYGLSRSIKKMCVIDEAWDLLHSSKQTASFMEAGYRRVAKQNGAFVTIVQSINDYFRNEIGISIFENSDNQIILAQLDSTLDQLKSNSRFSFTPYEEKILRSFSGTDEYKECLIKTPTGTMIGRILFDPFSRILYSTKGTEFEAVRKLTENGLSMEEAVSLVTSEIYGELYE